MLGTKFLTRYLINNEYLRKGGRGNKNYFIGALSWGVGGQHLSAQSLHPPLWYQPGGTNLRGDTPMECTLSRSLGTNLRGTSLRGHSRGYVHIKSLCTKLRGQSPKKSTMPIL